MPDIKKFFQSLTNDAYLVVVQGATHDDFSDRPLIMESSLLLKALHYFMPHGSIDAYRINDITNTYIVAFFDTYLKEISSPLLIDQKNKYPEVVREQFK